MGCGSSVRSLGRSIDRSVRKAGRQLDRGVRKAGRKIDEEVRRAAPDIMARGIPAVMREVGKAFTPGMPDITIDAGQTQEAGPQYVMPDEEELRRARRRRGAASRSGRASTIMSGSDSDGLGG